MTAQEIMEANGWETELVHDIVQKTIDTYEQSKWISVKNSMPDCSSVYIVCGKDIDYHPHHFSSTTDRHIHVCDDCMVKFGYDRFFINKPKPKPVAYYLRDQGGSHGTLFSENLY